MLGSIKRVVLPLLAVVLVAVAVSGCAFFKPGSLQVSQPAGIGSVRVHFELCSTGEKGGCELSESNGEGQQLLGFAVPIGASSPATVTAVPKPGAQPMVYFRNEQVGAALASEAKDESGKPWPPPGTQVIGYITGPIVEVAGPQQEWTVDAEFGLPPAADGGSSGAPYPVTIASGWRGIGEGIQPSQPLDCTVGEKFPDSLFSQCYVNEGTTLGVSDLKIKPPKVRATAFPGGKGTVAFSLDFASSANAPPSFSLKGSTSVPRGSISMPQRTYAPSGVAGATFRAEGATRSVVVNVPNGTKPGVYEATITATAAGGGAATALAKLKVQRPTIKVLGKPQRNRPAGTAVLKVQVPGAGTVTLSGKGVAVAKRTTKGPKTLKLPLAAKGAAKLALLADGSVRLRPKLKFKPDSGAAVKKTIAITLRLG